MILRKHIMLASFLIFLSTFCVGQNNLSISYSGAYGVADNLNICGKADTVSVRIQLTGGSSLNRADISADVQLFEGVEFIELLEGTSLGVTLLNNSNANQPVLSLPDLEPAGISFVDVVFSIKANCEFLDTLAINEQALVFDSWKFNYTLGSTPGLSETDDLPEYRDAFLIPFFTMEIEPRSEPVKVGECFNRTIKITNTSLSAYVSEMTYEFVQEIGVVLNDVLVNGNSVSFTSVPEGAFANRITVKLESEDFQQNESVNNGPGNGDDFFDAEELLTITEVLCFQSCELGRSSTHTASWGCDDVICNKIEAVDFVTTGLGNPTPNVQVVSNTDPGYCGSGSSTLRFSNIGYEDDLGFGAMYDLSVGIGLSGTFELSLNGYTITAMEIAGVDVSNFNAINALNDHPSFSVDPDGTGGLSDVDGDGFFDDLPVGEDFEVTAFVTFDCDGAATISHPDSCFNNFNTSFNGRIDYTNSCDKRDLRLQNSYYRPTNSNSGFENFTDPDAFLEAGTFTVKHTEQRSIRSFDFDCPGGGQLVAKVILPPGISPDLSQTQLIKNELTPFVLNNSFQNGDTLNLVFGGPLLSLLSGTYDLVLGFQADCTAELGPTEFPLIFEFQCPDCDCSHIWYCDELEGPWLHASNPPCPEEKLISCPAGIQTTGFNVERTTFGFTDNTYTTPFPKSLSNKQIAIPCDSVIMNISNVVGESAVSGDIGVIINYDNIDNSNSTEEAFLFTDGVVEFITGGSPVSANVIPSDLSVTSVDGKKEMKFDFNRIFQDLGLTLNPGDSINFSGNFYINPEGPIPFQFKGVPNFRAYGYSLEANEPIHCDKFGENFTLGKTNSIFDFPNSLDFPKGCQTGNLEYRLVTVNNGFSDFFGDEIRPATKIDSVILDFETTVFDAFVDGSVEVLVPGHPIHGNNYFPVKSLSDFSGGRYIAVFDTLDYVPALNDVTNTTFSMRVNLTPTCRSYVASEDGDNRYRFNSKMTFRDRFYANYIGDGTCMELKNEEVNQEIDYSIPPELELSPVSNSNYILLSDTAIWRVEICNQSALSDAGLTWLSIENPDNAIEVVSMTDVTNSANLKPLIVQQFGTNYFAYADGVLRGSGGNTVEDICNIIEVKALVQVCGTSVISAHTGWSCEAYNIPDWTPDLYDPCEEKSIPLSVSTRDPQLEADITDQPDTEPDICDTTSITVLLKNVDLGAVFDLQTILTIPPTGATFVPGSVEIAYPPSADFQPALGDPTFVSANIRGQNYQYDGFQLLNSYLQDEGLKGFSPANPSDSNQVKIRYKFITDCDFVSGSLAYFSFQGQKGCQEPSNFEAGETLPLYINGATPNPDKLFQIEFGTPPILISSNSDIDILVTNLTNSPSDSNDKIRFILPENTTYQSNSSVGISPAGWIPGEPDIRQVGGVQELIWTIPLGLTLNDRARLNFSINTPQYDCAAPDEQAKLATVSQTQLACGSAGTICDLQIITSAGGDDFITIAVGETLTLLNSQLTSACNLSDETVYSNLEFRADGFTFSNELINLNYFFDQNGNGEFDTGELISSVIKATPSSGNTWIVRDTTSISIDQVCALGIFINSDVLPICERAHFLLSVPVLQNSGNSLSVCGNEPVLDVQLGVSSCQSINYNYSWSAIPPANVSMLSATDIARPIASLPNSGGSGQFQFVLETTRTGCVSGMDTVTVLTGEEIDVTAVSPVFVPIGSSDILSIDISGGTAPFTFNWSPSTGLDRTDIQNPTVSPDSDIQYTVLVTDAIGCSAEAIVRVIARSPIEANVSFADTSICFDSRVQLFASGGTDYRWIANVSNPSPGTLNDFNIQNPFFENGIAGGTYEYEVIVSDSNFPGFSDTASVVIQVGVPISLSLPSSIQIARGDSATLIPTVSGGIAPLSYRWFPENGLRTPNQAMTVVVPIQSQDYTLVVTDSYGCQESASIFVELRDPVTGSVNFSDTTICFGEELQILASGGTDYEWIPSTANPSSGELNLYNIPNPIFRNGIAGEKYNFEVAVTDNTFPGNADTVEISITISALPIAEAGRDINICRGESTPVIGSASGGSGNYMYEWSTGDQTDVTIVTPADTTTYFFTVTDAFGCQSTDSIRINVVNCPCDFPEVASVSVQSATCGNNDGSAKIEINGNPDDYTFSWAPTPPCNQPSPNIADCLPAGGYIVRISEPLNSDCYIDFPVVISNQDGPKATASTDAATCELSDGTVTLLPVNYVYRWGDGEETNTRNDLPAGIYFPTITDPNSPDCKNVIMVEIEKNNPLSANVLVNRLPSCHGRDGSVTLQISGGSGNYSYSWSSNSDTQNNLAGGLHFVTVTDLSSNGCELEVVFNLNEDVPEADILISRIIPTGCVGDNDGRVNFTVNFDGAFAFPADTIITDGFRNFNNGSLTEGDYCIEIRDSNDCIAGQTCFSITDPDPISITATSFEECQNPGRVELELSGGTSPFIFEWSDLAGTLGDPEDRTDINAGNHQVTVTDARSCEVVSDIFVDSCTNCFIISAKDTLLFQANSCDSQIEICLPVSFQTANQLEIFDNGIQLNQFLTPCDLDTVYIYSFRNLYGEGDLGPYILENWMIDGTPVNGSFNDLSDLENLMNQLDSGGNWVLNEQNKSISGGNLNKVYGDITARDVTLGVSSQHSFVIGNPAGGYALKVSSGFHQIVISDPGRGCYDTIYTNVICTENDTVRVDLIIGETDTVCVTGNELLGDIDDFYNNCPDGTFAGYQFLNDSCVIISGDSIGQETACLVVCDSLDICDTTFVIVTVSPLPLPPKTVFDTIGIGQSVTICCDTPEVRLDLPIETITNICPDSSGNLVLFEIDTINKCVIYTGLDIGTEAACIEFCDAFGNCDTVNFSILVEPSDTIIRDTVLLNVDTVTYCFPRDSFPPIAQIFDDCINSNGTEVEFFIDSTNLCVTYTGIQIGSDTACIILIGNDGSRYRTTFIIDVVTPQPEIFCDEIVVGESVDFYLDTSEIEGAAVEITEFCRSERTDNANISFDISSQSVSYEGVFEGRDSACIVFCSAKGACDTVYFCLTVEDYSKPPTAICDTVDTDKNAPVVILVGLNDTLFGMTGCPEIIEQPHAGRAVVNGDCSITYIQSDEEFCDSYDEFRYQICNENGCSDACVIVNVKCIDITIFTAVSPNLDGVNDTFYIGGLEDKPDNNLTVYNRWGNLVFEQDGYDNMWDGTFNGNELPDGSYYYIFRVNDNGTNRLFRGYLEIYR